MTATSLELGHRLNRAGANRAPGAMARNDLSRPSISSITIDSIGYPHVCWLWGVLSGLCLARLVVSLVAGSSDRRPCPADRVRIDRCDAAGRRLHAAGAAARARCSARHRDVACPAIWCWGRRPVILCRKPPTCGGCRSIGSASSATSWRTGCGATSGRACSPRSWSACPALASAGVAGQASAEPTQRAGLRRLGARDRPGGRRTMPSRCWAWSRSARHGAGPVGGLEPSRPVGRVRHILDERRISPVGRQALGVRQRGGRGPGRLGARPGADAGRRTRRIEKPRTIAPTASRDPATQAEGSRRRSDARSAARSSSPTASRPPAPRSSGSASRKAQLPFMAMPKDQRARLSGHRPRPWPRPTTDAEGRFELAADFDPGPISPRRRVRR